MGMVHTATVKVIKGGRVTLPAQIRKVENIKNGDYVKITVEKIEKPTEDSQKNKSK